MQRGTLSFSLVRLNYDFHILTEHHQETATSAPPRIAEIPREASLKHQVAGHPTTRPLRLV
jgi:hypothetical protein